MDAAYPSFSVHFYGVTYMIVAPFELISGNEASTCFWTHIHVAYFCVTCSLSNGVLAGVISVSRPAFNAVLMLVFGFAFASYIQVLVLNGTLPRIR